jgi:hypothetical protein
MAFWSSTNLDPKRQFKFKVTFSRLDANGAQAQSTFLAQSAGRPQYTVSDGTKVHFLDKEFAFPGKVTWNPIDIKFVDAVSTNVSKDSYLYLQQAGWVNPAAVGGTPQTANYATIGKSTAVANSGRVQIDVLRSTGEVEDRWTLVNAWVTKVALNELDYAAENILTATYTFRYDWAEIAL